MNITEDLVVTAQYEIIETSMGVLGIVLRVIGSMTVVLGGVVIVVKAKPFRMRPPAGMYRCGTEKKMN